MLVILKESIENLGRVGDVVKVSPGYARNFLMPRRLVIPAQEGNVRQIEHHKKVLEKKRLAERASAEELARKLSEVTCSFKRKVGRNKKLFGSVSTTDIRGELEKAGYNVTKQAIKLKDPLKELGEHAVLVKLDGDVEATVKVTVEKE